jgi:hypothetical protein
MPASIWLQPVDEQQRRLRSLIEELAARHETVPFEPHLTVCGIGDPTPAKSGAAADYIGRCALLPFTLRMIGISCSTTTPFKAVVIDVENTAELQSFRAELRRIIGADEPEPPHISLLYTIDERQQRVGWAADEARLRTIAEECAARVADTEFVIDQPVVVAPEGDWTNIRSWKIVRQL